jgi:hypothetical protein
MPKEQIVQSINGQTILTDNFSNEEVHVDNKHRKNFQHL